MLLQLDRLALLALQAQRVQRVRLDLLAQLVQLDLQALLVRLDRLVQLGYFLEALVMFLEHEGELVRGDPLYVRH